LLNGVHTANNYDLLTAALRDEWGYQGIVMTDWGTTEASLICMLGANPFPNMKYPLSKASGCVKAGNDLTMPGSQGDIDDILYALHHTDAKYPLSLGELQRCAKRMIDNLL
ncbi:MAG: beta-glucosidase, partial [Lachnospiraceae bacterium]|nr:beta-glucosidase [Lachnospiraceae bacterium]